MSAWVLAGVILTGAWTQLDEIGWAGWVPLVVTLALDRRPGPRRMALPWPRESPPRVPLVACTLLCALMLAHVALTAREEFGFGGDEGYHLSATRAFALYYMRAGPILVAVMVTYAAWRWKRWPYAASIAMIGLIAGSYFLPASPLFGRYPAGFYHIATPLNVLFDVGGSPYPFTANHIVNGLSVPAWLFVLRPIVIGRWPDWQVLPVALLIYFQAPAFVYLSSTLIEPWAIVFMLLSVEALVALPPDDRWVAVLLAAIGTWFKETAVLLLPTIWLLACVEWKGWRPSLRPHALAVGVAALAPFFVYFMVRLEADIHRIVTVSAAAEVWGAARIREWFTNVSAQLGVTAVIGVALMFVATLRRVAWALTTIGLVLFFFVDTLGIPYTGYGRYQAFSLIALCGAVIAWTYRTRDRRVLIALPLVVGALQAVPVARAFALDFRPDYERNSLEWKDSLIRLPIRTLAEKIAATPGGDQVRRIRVITFGIDLISLRVAYPDLADRFDLQGDEQSAAAPDCRCRDNSEAVIAGFTLPAHFGDTPAAREMFNHVSAACVNQIDTTCRSRTVERHRSGAIVGAMGIGRILLLALPQNDERPKR
jgi:hypothetical protein